MDAHLESRCVHEMSDPLRAATIGIIRGGGHEQGLVSHFAIMAQRAVAPRESASQRGEPCKPTRARQKDLPSQRCAFTGPGKKDPLRMDVIGSAQVADA